MAFSLLMIFKEKKTVPNQPKKQQTHQPKPQPLGSLQSHEHLRQFIPEKRATVETQVYLVLQAGVFKHQ